jgi:hypothetical protein
MASDKRENSLSRLFAVWQSGSPNTSFIIFLVQKSKKGITNIIIALDGILTKCGELIRNNSSGSPHGPLVEVSSDGGPRYIPSRNQYRTGKGKHMTRIQVSRFHEMSEKLGTWNDLKLMMVLEGQGLGQSCPDLDNPQRRRLVTDCTNRYYLPSSFYGRKILSFARCLAYSSKLESRTHDENIPVRSGSSTLSYLIRLGHKKSFPK